MDASHNKAWDMILSAILEPVFEMCETKNNKRLTVDLNSPSKAKSSEDKQSSPSVVEYSPTEGQNLINLVNSKAYEPQISIKSGDYITIVYKMRLASGNGRNSTAGTNDTIATFGGNDSDKSTEEENETSDDFYLTAIDDVTNKIDSDKDEIEEELMHTTSNSAVCGCYENSHSRTKCLNTVKYDICLDDDAPIPVDYNEFCKELNPDKGSTVSREEARIISKEKLESSISRRKKRFLNLSYKKESVSLNDSFPETIFPPRKKRFTITSTPARNAKKDVISKLTHNSANNLKKTNSAPYAVEE